MTMLFARASLPAWVVILAIGAFLAPAGIATTVLLVALGIACIPAVVTAGVWKRTAFDDDTAAITDRVPEALDRDTAAVTDRVPAVIDRGTAAVESQVPEVIDAEFTVEDAMPTGQILR